MGNCIAKPKEVEVPVPPSQPPTRPVRAPKYKAVKRELVPVDDMDQYLEQDHAAIFESNVKWVERNISADPRFFVKLSEEKFPDYLYIGCADSRVPANEIMGLDASDVFIHRNIANLVPNTDLNAMSVIEYAVAHLHVKHIIVCGHYNCGGVQAALAHQDLGLLNPWLRNVRDVYRLHERQLDQIRETEPKHRLLCELNVLEQARNVLKTATVQKSYFKHKYPIVHAWIFDLRDGLLKDLNFDFAATLEGIKKIYNLEHEDETKKKKQSLQLQPVSEGAGEEQKV